MIALIENLPANIVGYRYSGEVTAADYESVLYPTLKAAMEKNKELKVLCELSYDFKGFSLGSLKDDLAVGLKYYKDWKKIAFVSDNEWMNHLVKAFGFLIPGQVRIFKKTAMDEAKNWLEE